jgi:hypothetical protein
VNIGPGDIGHAALSSVDVARYRRIRNVAILMDAALRIPGTRFRVGLASIIGLPPGVGDAFLTAISLWIVWQGRLLGLPRTKIAMMLGNVAIETALGGVPVIGDVMDVVWKANLRNLAIIDAHLASIADDHAPERHRLTRHGSSARPRPSPQIG